MNSTQSHEKNTKDSDDLKSRRCALNILCDVLDRKTALDIALDRSDDLSALDKRDRAFVRMMVTTALRHLGQIDALISASLKRKDSIKTPVLHHILRMGVTQMFFMKVPDHASVDTCVRLCEELGMDKQKGFINGMLRNLGREGQDLIFEQDAPRLNTPEWLLKIWIEDYGMNGAGKIAQANMSEAALDISVKDPNDITFFGGALQATTLATGTLRSLAGGHVLSLEGFDEGKWWVQDAAAAIPATLFGDISGKHVVDMCAAPGGKTLQLAAKGAKVTAIDRSAKRLKKLEENLVRMSLKEHVQVEVADGANWNSKDPVDYILLDAPCSATGTMRRHPDMAYLKSPKDIDGLSTIQERLLNHSAKIISVGGVLIYCTCSIQKAEGEVQIEKFLSSHPNFKRQPIQGQEIGNYDELINENGDIRILPYMLGTLGGIDGFFISRLTRTA